ncbi:ferrous iron transport protein B [Actinomyces sp. B33]|uniref:ferrous iron transport protein B n=1 Tax=Actinomyces sp. B33 TaxID=2942131 RepID=UPI002341B66D|nr:ferrous iron transport protein B [Actinomyces sp. B33]MDC4233501.1 ferrous iron transport protein B [Actinomyces sp. B33]
MSCPACAPSAPPSAALDRPGVQPTILLVGNPNVGKSTLFNLVTGARQAVVNAPGTTVEVMAGTWSSLGARVLDLPGTYSLIAASIDEQVVVDTLAGAPGSFTDPARGLGVDLVLAVLDATALTRSLYLLGQIARTGRPVAAVITLADVAEREGETIDVSSLSRTLGIPMMVVDPRTRAGIAGLDDMVRAALVQRPRVVGVDPDPAAPGYNQVAAAAAASTRAADADRDCGCGQGPDCRTREPAPDSTIAAACAAETQDARADDLFAWVDAVEAEAFGARVDRAALSRSDRIDRLLLHPVVGIPVFFALMWLLFKVAGEWVGPVQDLFDSFFTNEDPGAVSLAAGVNVVLDFFGWGDTWLHGLLVGGLCTGLGVVASFLPLMFVIFLLISILEDSGYMVRAAFLGDRVMRAIGLDGRVIMPLIMGFGCNLPSLAAARTLPSASQRLVTTLITPYTSCAARLTIYLMIARIFFPDHAGTVIFGLYLLSLALVVVAALILKPFITKGEAQAPLMLVLPAYQTPRVLVTLKNTWMRAWAFVTGAGKIIVVMTLVVWLMSAIPTASGHSFADEDLAMEDSLYGATAQVLEPVFAPTGFGEWHMTGALMTGFVAKETVISSIVTSYNLDPSVDGGDAEDGGDDLGSLPELVTESFTKSAGDAAPVAAFAFLVFVLAYTPCLATVAEQARQIGGKTTAVAVVVQLVAAWALAVAIFQIGRLFW